MAKWEPPRVNEFTPPSALCPHPEWWSAWNAMSTEVEVSILVASLVQATQPEFIVEVGAHYGQTTERIGKVLIESGHGHLVSLEIDHGLHGSAVARCWHLPPEICEIIEIDSRKYIPPQPINFLFVDGAEDRVTDVRYYRPFMAPRGIVVVHDMASPGYIEQTQEMLEICGDGFGGNHLSLDTPRGILIMRLP